MLPTGDYREHDDALARIADRGPDLANELTNHAPMVAEALCALGRRDAVTPFIERYLPGTVPWPEPRGAIPADGWRAALGRTELVGDWRALFTRELADRPWRDVLARWLERLTPGIASTHGLIRVAHAVRALRVDETPQRRRELGDALASWAYCYRELPASRDPGITRAVPAVAIDRIPLLPASRRSRAASIIAGLERLDDFPPFAAAIDLADLDDRPEVAANELADAFARVYLAGAHDPLTVIVLTHAITAAHALANVAPAVSPAAAHRLARQVWHVGCAMHSAFGRALDTNRGGGPAAVDDLVDRAIAHGDEHAIKLTEAAHTRHRAGASVDLLAAAAHALATLPVAGSP